MTDSELAMLVQEIGFSGEVVLQDCPQSVAYSYVKKINRYCNNNGYDWHVVHKPRPDGSFLIMLCRNLEEGEPIA